MEVKEISDRLKLARDKFELKQSEFASKCGIAYSTYQKYEMELSKPSSDALAGFVKAGINANWILTGDGEMLLMKESQKAATTQPQDVDKNKNKIIDLLLLCIKALGIHYGNEYIIRETETQIKYARKLLNEVDQYDPTVDPSFIRNLSEDDLINFIKFLIVVRKLPKSIEQDY